ncbi:MAG TPA: glycosyltransferase family protein [Candidatus Binatia bacterium]|nr:glycosyltransferase family protein [Candidatus Binatia bacterium]
MSGRTVAIVQARMGSTRLPGKVLAEIGGRTMLARVLDAVRACGRVDETVVATSDVPADDATAAAAARAGCRVHRGSEDDVLRRYVGAMRAADAEVVVRLTADCPFLDPALVDDAIARFHAAGCDYASNGLAPPHPRGLDVEVVRAAVLARADAEARARHQRAHVTAWVYAHPERFRLLAVPTPPELHGERWTVDTAEDLAFARAVAARLPRRVPSWREVWSVLEREPALRVLNAHVRQKALPEA